MEAAGANVIERTGDDAVMGMPGLAKIREHTRINTRLAAWLDRQRDQGEPIALHIPVDSPAANFPICALAKKRGIRVMHLVAPQVWAWGSWRVRKLRRRTDLVLCILPFEEEWFRRRGVPARFIGHPLFDDALDTQRLDALSETFGDGTPRVALMPGSRPGEIGDNFPILLDAFRRLSAQFPGLRGVVAATKPQVEERVRLLAEATGGWPDNLITVSGQTDAVVRWCELALVVSGTVTLQIAKQLRPMVIVYNLTTVQRALIKLILSTEFITLPNLISGRRIVPEFVPHWGGPERIIAEAARLLDHPDQADRQRQDLAKLIEPFRGKNARVLAANAIEEFANIIVPPAS
jgi:lipid-A-disaccharide synthase